MTTIPMYATEGIVCGIDGVGDGALFGPLFAAAVILPPDEIIAQDLIKLGVRDSKQLTPKKRKKLLKIIREVSLGYGIGMATAMEINQRGTGTCAKLAMQRAIRRIRLKKFKPDAVLVDGINPIPNIKYSQTTVIGGDKNVLVIAAASIVAKVCRDELIVKMANKYPGYGLEQHKGYATEVHIRQIQRLGLSDQHRRCADKFTLTQLKVL